MRATTCRDHERKHHTDHETPLHTDSPFRLLAAVCTSSPAGHAPRAVRGTDISLRPPFPGLPTLGSLRDGPGDSVPAGNPGAAGIRPARLASGRGEGGKAQLRLPHIQAGNPPHGTTGDSEDDNR